MISGLGLADVRAECDFALQDLQKLFLPHCKLTLVMRNPESSDGDMVLSLDDLDAVIVVLEKMKTKEPISE